MGAALRNEAASFFLDSCEKNISVPGREMICFAENNY